MWCYQKPGFKALLLAELQRQQQCSRFCDTMLKTEDISVPAHSCILSAISPHISSALSSAPSPPPGQSCLLEFQSLRACTLLRVVRLMYSGEMVGEGEKEKQEAISAAAKLGIQGLVEVTTGNGENSTWVEVGVQTEPLSEKEWREGKWVREVRDRSTILWKERSPGGVKDTGTQTEQLQLNTTAPESSFETIDLACLQNLRHADSTVLPPQIPLIPISLLYPPNENQNPQPFFAPLNSLQEAPAAGPSSAVMDLQPSFSSLFSQETASSAATQSSWTASQVAARKECSSFEQFQGNILGFTGNFVNQRKQSRRGRPRGRRRDSAARGARTAGRGERRPRRPSAGTVGRGRGGFTVTLDVQDVGLSAVQKAFLQRWSTRSSRAGQGGGAVGRKLYLKTREVPIFTKGRKKGREKVIKSSPNKVVLPLPEGRRVLEGGCNPRTAPASTPSLHPTPSPGLWSSTGSYVSPASSILPNTPAPPPPRDEQVEHIDRLLEEVMMGLDIFPNIGAQRVLPANSSSCTDATATGRENRQQGHAAAVVKEGGSSGAGNSKGPGPHQQGETDFREMLENFLSTFEQEIHGCAVTEDAEIQTGSPAGSCQAAANQQAAETQTPARSQQLKPSAHHTTRPQCTSSRKKSVPNTPQTKRGRNKYNPSQLQTSVPSSELNVRDVQKQENQQLQQTPVVKLDRRVPLPDRVILRGNRLHNLNIKSENTESKCLARKSGSVGKSQTVFMGKKMYPIRSKLKEANMTFFLEQPLEQHRCQRECRKRRPKNGNVLDLSENVQPAEHVCPEERLQDVSDILEDTAVQPQEVACEARRKVTRRKAEVKEEVSEHASVSKRVCLEPMTHTTPPSKPQPRYPNCEPVSEAEEVIDAETLSVSSPGCLGETAEAAELENSSCDEVIDVDGEDEDVDVLGGSGFVAQQLSVTWEEPLNPDDEEEEIDIVGEKPLNPSSSVCGPHP